MRDGTCTIEQSRRNFIAGIVHGTFLAGSIRMADIQIILPVFINAINPSPYLISLLSAIYNGAERFPQMLFAHLVQRRRSKKVFLYIAVFSRLATWSIMGVLVFLVGGTNPGLVVAFLIALVFLYSVAGGLGGVAYADVIGKVIVSRWRGRFFGFRQISGGLLAIAVGYAVKIILSEGFPLAFPFNYGLLFLLAGLMLAVAALGFVMIDEPPGPALGERQGFRVFLRELPRLLVQDRVFMIYNLVEVLSSLHYTLLPFYIVFLRAVQEVPLHYSGIYLIAQAVATTGASPLWGFLSDRMGSHRVIQACTILGTVTPVLAVLLRDCSPLAYVSVFALIGVAIGARRVGFEAYLIDIAPVEKRATYKGINGTLLSGMLILPFAIGAFVDRFSYQVAFLAVAAVLAIAFALSMKLYSSNRELGA